MTISMTCKEHGLQGCGRCFPPSSDIKGTGLHKYVSTYCIHDQHDVCRRVCKVCESQCLCRCHEDDEAVR